MVHVTRARMIKVESGTYRSLPFLTPLHIIITRFRGSNLLVKFYFCLQSSVFISILGIPNFMQTSFSTPMPSLLSSITLSLRMIFTIGLLASLLVVTAVPINAPPNQHPTNPIPLINGDIVTKPVKILRWDSKNLLTRDQPITVEESWALKVGADEFRAVPKSSGSDLWQGLPTALSSHSDFNGILLGYFVVPKTMWDKIEGSMRSLEAKSNLEYINANLHFMARQPGCSLGISWDAWTEGGHGLYDQMLAQKGSAGGGPLATSRPKSA
ncbi:hypothetical protein F5880DRAFT_1558385 [Lentinula raphanica]|nr:hypothetical protein F5880DRAFT_1558385 [Lentinula raphanica]